MSELVLPEIVIYNTLETIKTIIKIDIEEKAAKPKESLLYRLLGSDVFGQSIKLNKYNYFEQAKKIFSKDGDLSVNFGYNFAVAKDISLHILLPSESATNQSIGSGEGYITQEEEIELPDGKKGTNEYETRTQMFESNYQVMITSVNSSEVNTVYTVLKAMLIVLIPHLELLGLRTPKLSGNDIMMQDDSIPTNIFHKVLNISFLYEMTVPDLISKEIIKSFVFKSRMFEK